MTPERARRRSWYWCAASVAVIGLRFLGWLYDRNTDWLDPVNQLTLGAEWLCLSEWNGHRQWAKGYELGYAAATLVRVRGQR